MVDEIIAKTIETPTNAELQGMLEQVAMYCDELKAEITRLRSDLALHEHGAGGRCMIPVEHKP